MATLNFSALTMAAVLCCAVPAFAQAPAERPPPAGSPATAPINTSKIGKDLYLITGRGGNSVVRITPDGLILIDNKVMRESVYQELKVAIDRISGGKTIKYAFVTHHHADIGGNNKRLMDEGIPLIGQKNVVEILRTYKSTIAPVNPAPPSITFDKEYRVTLGGVEARAYYWGPAHTDADIAIVFPDQKVVVAGSLLTDNGEPDVDALDGHGSLFGLLARIDDILKLDFVIAVPGDGGVMTRDDVLLYRRKIATLIERGQAAVRRGVPPESLLSAMESYDLGFRLVGHFWSEPARIAPIYAELAKSVK